MARASLALVDRRRTCAPARNTQTLRAPPSCKALRGSNVGLARSMLRESDMDSDAPRRSDRLAASVRAAAVLAVSGALLGGLLTLVRPWYLGWGATAEEREGALPGDSFSAGPPYETRAIDIRAPAEQVFGWVAQLGQNRAGFYSYTLLENLMARRARWHRLCVAAPLRARTSARVRNPHAARPAGAGRERHLVFRGGADRP
jgi:hypothetical protein